LASLGAGGSNGVAAPTPAIMLRRIEECPIETNYTGFYASLNDVMSSSNTSLLATQARCRAALAAIELAQAHEAAEQNTHATAPKIAGGCPQSPMALPSRKRPFGDEGFRLPAGRAQGGCPQSPISRPSTYRPLGREPAGCPQSPVSRPSLRRPPLGREISDESLPG
jgi:hypothetical protein